MPKANGRNTGIVAAYKPGSYAGQSVGHTTVLLSDKNLKDMPKDVIKTHLARVRMALEETRKYVIQLQLNNTARARDFLGGPREGVLQELSRLRAYEKVVSKIAASK